MVLKRLKLHQFLMVWHEIFLTHKHVKYTIFVKKTCKEMV